MTNDKFDVIVIGAGSAGCLAAFSAAKEGLEKVVLIDRKPLNQIGKKVCGDGIGIKHLTFLNDLGFPIKERNVIQNEIKTAQIIAPNSKEVDKLPIQGQLAIINRYEFGQALLERAIDEGVKLKDRMILSAIKRDKRELKISLQKSDGKRITLSTTLLIDGSGVNSKVRENSNFFDEKSKLADTEQYYCYREINRYENLEESYNNSAIFEFSFEKTHGGYIWFFSRGQNELNAGIGIPKSWVKRFSPKEIFYNYITPRFSKSKTLDSGGGFVPTRQPLPTHVCDNIILIGDAGTIVNPLHGGGLSPSLASGYIAGKIAAMNVPDEAVTEESLWGYNKQIMERYGLRYSILDLYRILLQNIPDNELLHALENDYFPLGKIFYAREYETLMKLSRKIGEIWVQLPNPRFNLLPKYIEQINEITKVYPISPEEITQWADNYRTIYSTYEEQVKMKI